MIELATTTEQPKMTKSAQIRNYVAKHPKAKSADVAKAIGVTTAYVATVMWTAKKKAKVAKVALFIILIFSFFVKQSFIYTILMLNDKLE